MILILCLDEKGGLAFNKRRQTKDKNQRKHLLKRLCGSLFLGPYTAKLVGQEFSKKENLTLICGENYPELAAEAKKQGKKLYIWMELEEPQQAFLKECISEIWIYEWNRLYASDVRFERSLLMSYELVGEEHFAGTSHDRISFKRYVKEEEVS